LVNQAIVQWLKQYLKQGYDLATLKQTLTHHGYTEKDIDEAVRLVYGNEVKHTIHLSKTTTALVLAILFTLVIASGAIIYFLQPNNPSELMDVRTEIINADLKAGEKLNFNVELLSLGSKKRYDVDIRYTIEKEGRIITFKEETVGIETSKSYRTYINMPKIIEPGNYVLRTVASYNKQIARAASTFIIYEESTQPTCYDNIKNQDETGVDCGGSCDNCPTCNDNIQNQGEVEVDCGGPCSPCRPKNTCNDNDICTEDKLVNGRCQFNKITPCCGDAICDKEEVNSCIIDCPSDDPFAGMTVWEKLNSIKELAKANDEVAVQHCETFDSIIQKEKCLDNVGRSSKKVSYCKQITDERTKEECIIDVAESTKDPNLCNDVIKETRRDRCYIHFAKTGLDYTVCDKISDYYLKQLCNSMKSLSENSP